MSKMGNNPSNHSDEDNLLRRSLATSPETEAQVGERLHQDIMRAVRLAQPERSKPLMQRLLPVWASGLAAVAIVVVFLSEPPVSAPVNESVSIPPPQEIGSAPTIFAVIEERLAALSQESGMAEEELRKELERLKTDLQRFGIDT
jgi:hypothetical protein